MDAAMVEFAKLFYERNNTTKESFVIGKVVSSYPNLKINDGDEILLTKHNLIVAGHLLPHSRSFNAPKDSGVIQFTDSLKTDEKVIMIPSSDGQKYIVLDRVVEL